MKPTATVFEFSKYRYSKRKNAFLFEYKIHFSNADSLRFVEEISLPRKVNFQTIPKKLLRAALESTHLMLGVSYYKLYCPKRLSLPYALTKGQAVFWTTVYQKGLGEFCFRNKINPKEIGVFPAKNSATAGSSAFPRKERTLLGIGGGKDSIVAAELLRHELPLTAFVLQTQRPQPVLSNVIKKLAFNNLELRRTLDNKIFLSHPGSFNGHIPISGIIAMLGVLAAILFDYSYVIVGNEQSSNVGNVRYKGLDINHQWSKSSEFEAAFQNYVRTFLTPNITYFSALRAFHEIRIVEMFSHHPRYFQSFTSCNRSFTIRNQSSNSLWCGHCAKCAFMFLLLAAFLPKRSLLRMFGANLLNEKSLLPLYRDLLGFGGLKPFDCVGTFEEARIALRLVATRYSNDVAVQRFLRRTDLTAATDALTLLTSAAPQLPARFAFLGRKNVLLLGYGKEGKATAHFLKKYYPKVKIAIGDQNRDEHYLDKQHGYDLAIKTPGLAKRFVSVPYSTATNIFFSRVRNPIIGITGSKGKSTTASLIAWILEQSGKKVRLLGNIGHPMLDALGKTIDPKEIFVLELSSYQLEDLQYSPHISVVLNLFPEHLNYHGGETEYYEAKRNIIRFQNEKDVFVFNRHDKLLRLWAKSTSATTQEFSPTDLPKHLPTALLGEHNRSNIAAAFAVAKLLGISAGQCRAALESFAPLPHRLEHVGTFHGIEFYDDAISTTPESTMMALHTIPHVDTCFLGGEDRGYEFAALEKLLRRKKVRNVVLFPDTGKRMLKRESGFNILRTEKMSEAVRFAYQVTKPGSACLLSTASPSYSLWKNFEAKGDEFQALVKKFAGKLKPA